MSNALWLLAGFVVAPLGYWLGDRCGAIFVWICERLGF